ncbi:MAG: FkbM family methyltransferase [Ilumatobacter sp.]|jgi:FkbM family methyltransferase|uniref:FkbM family methyltransferase n=1 Tax=Ilumatobacter sp. TaxID=1967498 RepID=UPI0039194DFE
MSYRIPLPAGGARPTLDVIDPFSSMVQRFLRREGLAAYEPETAATLLALFDQHDGPFTLYDVGANIGLYSHLCAAMFDDATVHAFEPTPDVAEIARSIARANSLPVEVFEAAVSDSPGTATLFLSETSDASNSLVDGFKTSIGEIDVQRITLDEHWATTGVAPAVLKIDVETHEPEVLAGAMEMIAATRPYVVIEVLRRRKTDQGPIIQAAFEGLGYSFYPLSATTDWQPAASITGSGTVERDWLLAPEPLPADFAERWTIWSQRLTACTRDRNSRPPIGGAARAAYRRGGVRELRTSGQRFVDDVVRPGLRRRWSSLRNRLRRS